MDSDSSKKGGCGCGGLGGIIAVLLSWTVNHSILWAILHFFFSWLYVIYWVIKYHK